MDAGRGEGTPDMRSCSRATASVSSSWSLSVAYASHFIRKSFKASVSSPVIHAETQQTGKHSRQTHT